MTRSSNSGLVVRDAAVASPIAQVHQAIGCRSRGSPDNGAAGPVTARQTPRLRRATTPLTAIATAIRATTPQVTTAGTRAGWSAVGALASAGSLGVESPGDSASSAGSSGSAPALAPPSRLSFSDGSSTPFLVRESLGDSGARGDSDGSDAADSDGVAAGGEVGEVVGDGLLDCDPFPDPLFEPPSPAGLDVGEDVGEEVGEEDGELVGAEDGDGVGDGEAANTGGATAGGAALPLPCFHAQPTEPPAGTVREPEL